MAISYKNKCVLLGPREGWRRRDRAVEIIQGIVFQPLIQALNVPWGLLGGIEKGLQPVCAPKGDRVSDGSEKGSHFYCIPALCSLGCTKLPQRVLFEDQDLVQALALALPCEPRPQGCDCYLHSVMG